jgi:hypothetical protein
MSTQYSDTHLDVDKALDCGVAMAYLIKAFANLNETERANWLQAYSDAQRYELGSLAISWGFNGDFIFTMALEQAGVVDEALDLFFGSVNASLEGTPFADAEYRTSYVATLSPALAKMQEQAKRQAEQGDDDEDDSSTEELMALLQLLGSLPRSA